MATDVIMPALGLAQETGKVVRWLKPEGETVVKGEPLLEIETDKVTVEVEAPADGVLAGLTAAEGDDVPVGSPVAVILAPGEEASDKLSRARESSGTMPAGREPAPSQRPERRRTEASDKLSQEQKGAPVPASRRLLASPKARRLAADHGVDLDSVGGSGAHGEVVAADVEAFVGGDGEARIRAPEEATTGAVWRRMAERTLQSWQSAPHFFLLREVDAGQLEAWRASVRTRPRHEGVTHTDLLAKLCAAALRLHPRVNSSWRDGGIVANSDVNVGIAVALEDGLVVPVIHGADRLELDEIADRRASLVEAARNGRLLPEHVRDGTFTISNLGMYGVDAFLAIVNPPQAAILAVGRIAERVVPVDGRPAVRPTMLLGLSFDHRVVDGARGAEFLDTLASSIEEPAGLES